MTEDNNTSYRSPGESNSSLVHGNKVDPNSVEVQSDAEINTILELLERDGCRISFDIDSVVVCSDDPYAILKYINQDSSMDIESGIDRVSSSNTCEG